MHLYFMISVGKSSLKGKLCLQKTVSPRRDVESTLALLKASLWQIMKPRSPRAGNGSKEATLVEAPVLVPGFPSISYSSFTSTTFSQGLLFLFSLVSPQGFPPTSANPGPSVRLVQASLFHLLLFPNQLQKFPYQLLWEAHPLHFLLKDKGWEALRDEDRI